MHHSSGLYILLAAGFSRRFGSPKLQHPLPSGLTIVHASIDNLKASGCDFVVIIREGDQSLYNHLKPLNVGIIAVKNAEQGLSSVIAEAFQAISSTAVDWVGVCLADMPYIQPKTLSELTTYATPSTIIRPSYRGKQGHPVLFGRDFFDELATLTGDDGAKSIIKRFPDALHVIDVDDPMVLYDIDILEDVR